ncbi:MAG: ABC transporter ATP-binding protein [Micromonosporaceae bacterium]
MTEPLLQVDDLVTSFPERRGGFGGRGRRFDAVAGVSFTVDAGRTLAVVGESGCGKSTLARTLVGLETPSNGQVRFAGERVLHASGDRLRELRRSVQVVFQDPYASLYPRARVGQIISEPWLIHPDVCPRRRWPKEVARLLDLVGLAPEYADRFPHQLSGGQRQRVSIARALALRPQLLICDEVTSALDVSIQAQVLNLLKELQRELGVAYLFISHDLAVVRHIADQVAVMYLGKIVEMGDSATVLTEPTHPYTRALLSSVPMLRPWSNQVDPISLEGDLPSPSSPPDGCRFRTRCWRATQRCQDEAPALRERPGGVRSACFHPLDSDSTRDTA